jgi:ketosteroid isomerase-like protein
MKQSIVVALVAVLLISCAPQTDVEGLKKRVEDYNAVSKDAMLSGDHEKALAYYDDNAISLPANATMLRGKEAIGKWMKDMAAMGMKFSKVDFKSVEIDASGSLGYEVGSYEMTMEAGGMRIDDKGKYLVVWKRQADGAWKVYVEIWNTDMPMPQPEPPIKTPTKSKTKK